MAVPEQTKDQICADGAYCSKPQSTKVPNLNNALVDGKNYVEGNYFTSTHVTYSGTAQTHSSGGNISGGKTELYRETAKDKGVIKYQLIAVTSDGGKTWNTTDDGQTLAASPADLASLHSTATGSLGRNVKQQIKTTLEENNINKTGIESILPTQTTVAETNTDEQTNDTSSNNTGTTTTPTQNPDPDPVDTRNNFGEYTYPLDLASTEQDIIQFEMIKYKSAGLNIGRNDRDQAGEGDRNIIGTVILPIPSGIKDNNSVDWGGTQLNAVEQAAARFAMKGIMKGAEGVTGALDQMGNTWKKEDTNITKTVGSFFAAAAIGKDFKNLMGREYGQILNPNMELLFNNPVLRPFEFNFLLAPRNPKESEAIAHIIRFFKQGMAAKRTQGNLFLKAPNTFQLTYKHRGKGGSNHQYLNKFKECALKTCSIDYTPNQSYSTYTDGSMTAYTMSLSFQELTPIYEDDYESLEGRSSFDAIDPGSYETGPSNTKFPAEIGF